MSHLARADNAYDGSPSLVTWAGVGGATRYENRAYCNAFVTALLKTSYGLVDDDIEAWFGSKAPSAAHYQDAINAGRGFDRIEHLDEIAPGDLIAIRYPAGSGATGHVAVVRRAPTGRVATAPLVPGSYQFEISVVDSSRTTHGALDTRTHPDGTTDAGVGIGVMRLYTDADLRIVGHTWSTSSSSAYRAESSYPLVIGRLDFASAPWLDAPDAP